MSERPASDGTGRSAPRVRGIVVGHGSMAEGLVDAVRQITGAEADALVPLSNRGIAPDALAREIERLSGSDPVIVFTDLRSGSCALTAQRLLRGREDAAVVFGVNLPQLLDFVTHRDLPVPILVRRVLEHGRAGICCAPAGLEQDGDPPLPDR